MPIEKLTAKFVRDCRTPGMFGDGRGLWLRVTAADQRSWVYRYMITGRAREAGLGSVLDVPLAEARRKAAELRILKAAGTDPLDVKRQQRAAAKARVTFKEAAEAYIETHRAGWKNPKHTQQWGTSLRDYAFPILGSLDVASIATEHVLQCLKSHWTAKTETMTRVRSRIELVLSWATAKGHRSPDVPNPARWKNHLDHLLPKPSKITSRAHHGSMPYADLPRYFATLGDDEVSRALKFLILTAARSGEVFGAPWIEISGDTWVIPAARMKNGKEHRVPLVPDALAVLGTPGKGRIFKSLHRDSLIDVVEKLGVTVHGMRASFSTWASEQTDAPHEVIEACLAHQLGTETSRAYLRSDLLDKRRDILTQWAAFCTGDVDN